MAAHLQRNTPQKFLSREEFPKLVRINGPSKWLCKVNPHKDSKKLSMNTKLSLRLTSKLGAKS